MATAFPRVLLVAATGVAMACTAKDAGDKTAAGSDTAAAPAAAAAAAEPTANDFSNYKLDMGRMRKYAAAIKGFSALSPSDTSGVSGLNMSGNESTAETIAKIESNPVARRVLADAGLSARDYVWITAAYLQAAMTQGLMEVSPEAKMPEGQNPQNVEFLKANKAELEAIMKDAGMTR
jgi:hypothetical protein